MSHHTVDFGRINSCQSNEGRVDGTACVFWKVPYRKDHASKRVDCIEVTANKNYTRVSSLSVPPAIRSKTLAVWREVKSYNPTSKTSKQTVQKDSSTKLLMEGMTS